MGTTKAKKTREDGWLWKVGGVGTKSAEDIQKWLDEGQLSRVICWTSQRLRRL